MARVQRLLFFFFFGAAALGVARADQNLAGNVTVTGGSATGNLNVTGALNVTGTIDSVSNSFVFGTQGASFGGALFYQDNNVDTFTFSTNRSPASWLWQHNAAIPAMRLDASHVLTLYQANGTSAGAVLNPVTNQLSLGTATLTGGSAGSLTSSGAVTVGGTLTAQSSLVNSGTISGGTTGLNLSAGGTNQNITLSSSAIGDIVFNTNGVERARINSAGYVGVGTATPLAKLHLAGTSTDRLLLDNGIILSQKNVAGSVRNLLTHYNDDQVYLDNPDGNIWLRTTGGTSFFGSSGSVGIGTSVPQAKFHVFSGSSGNNYVQYTTTARLESSGDAGLTLLTPGANKAYIGQATPLDGGSAFIMFDGTARAMTFNTVNGTERVRIDQFGNVGVGTATIDAKLTVRGENMEISLGRGLTDGNGYGRLGFDTGYEQYITNNGYLNGSAWNYINPSGYGGTATRFLNSGGIFQFDTASGGVNPVAWNTRLYVANNGNVGIGTAAPWSIAHVVGPASEPTLTYQSKAIQSWNWPSGSELDLTISNASPYTISFQTRYTLGSGTAYPLALNPLGGNVGIGTTNPTQKLSVNGTIRAKEVIVDTGWSDYVFDEGYRLAPLSEVEQRIKSEKHLPGIPTAQEVADHGIKMGDMESKLLAKVEELTLHLIAQEKDIAALRQQVAELRAGATK